jgi:gliding motility-associated-like protein
VGLISSTAMVCNGSQASLKGTGAISYTWSPAAGLNNTTGSSVIATPTSPTKYIVTGTAANGCTDTASVTIGINPSPTVTIKLSAPSYICSGKTDTLIASGAPNYVWSPSTYLNSTTGDTVISTPPTNTTYTVIGTNSFGCNDTAHIMVTVVPTPTLSITPNTTICPGDSIYLVGGGASLYSWNPAATLDSISVDSVSAKPLSNITYTVVGSAGGCSSKDSVTITVGTLKVTLNAVSDTLCNGNSTSITASGAVTYIWNPGNSLNDSVTTTVTATPTITTTYTVTGTSGKGCQADTTITITINPNPTLNITVDSALICFGTGGTLISASGATSYIWSPSGSLTCSTCAVTNANPSSTTLYTVIGTNNFKCTSTDTITISVDKPTIKASASSPAICNGLTTTITANGNATYVWSPASSLSTSSGTTVVANPLADTTYTVVGTDILGCKDSTNVYVTVNANPVVKATSIDSSICSGNNTSLTGIGASSYSWTPVNSVTCSTCASTSANPTSSTTYTLVGTNANGCTDTVYLPITVNVTPVVKIAPLGDDTLCPKQSVNLTATGAASYVWSPSTGLNTTNGTTVIASPTVTPIVYKVVGSNGACKDSALQTIYSYPKLTLNTTPENICLGENGQVIIMVSGGKSGYTYNWLNASPPLPNGPGPYTVTPGSSTYYICSVTDGCGTTEKDSMLIFTEPNPTAGFTASPNPVLGGEYVSFTNKSTGATAYYWSLGNGASTVDSFPYYQYIIPGTYFVYLIATNQFGCADTAYDTIHVQTGIYVPNVFTPNGDGQNDVFHVTAGGLQSYSIEIFNRWGERVFQADSPDIDWTGRSTSGVMESDGIYYYILKATDYNNTKRNLNGYIQLIR